MPLFPTLPSGKKTNKKGKNEASSAQINIAVPLAHTDDVITQLGLLGRLLCPPEGNSATLKKEQHTA